MSGGDADFEALFARDADSRLLDRRRQELGRAPHAPAASSTPFNFGAESMLDDEGPPARRSAAMLRVALEARPARELIPGAVVTIVATVYDDGDTGADDVRLRIAPPGDAEPIGESFVRDGLPIDGEALLGEGLRIGGVPAGGAVRVRFALRVLPGTDSLNVTAHAAAPGVPAIAAPSLRLSRRAGHAAYEAPRPFFELELGEHDDDLLEPSAHLAPEQPPVEDAAVVAARPAPQPAAAPPQAAPLPAPPPAPEPVVTPTPAPEVVVTPAPPPKPVVAPAPPPKPEIAPPPPSEPVDAQPPPPEPAVVPPRAPEPVVVPPPSPEFVAVPPPAPEPAAVPPPAPEPVAVPRPAPEPAVVPRRARELVAEPAREPELPAQVPPSPPSEPVLRAQAAPEFLFVRAIDADEVRALERVFAGALPHGLAAVALLSAIACADGPLGEALGLDAFARSVSAALPRALVSARMNRPTPPVVTREALDAIRPAAAVPGAAFEPGGPTLAARLPSRELEALRGVLGRDLADPFLRGAQVLLAIVPRSLDGIPPGEAARVRDALAAYRVAAGAWLMRVTVRRAVDKRYDPLTAADATLHDAGRALVGALREAFPA